MAKNTIGQQRKRKSRSVQRGLSGALSEDLFVIATPPEELNSEIAMDPRRNYFGRWIQLIFKRYQGVQWHPVDVICLTYTMLISSILVIFHRNVIDWKQLLLINSILLIATFELVRFSNLRSSNVFLAFVRTVYPAVFLGWGWSTLNSLVPIFFGNYWATGLIIGADKFIFGVHPTIWFQQFHNPLLDEIMCTFYTGYYLFMPAIILSFFLCGKRREALAVFSLAAFTYFVNFILFYLLPAIGPQMVPNLDGFGQTNFSGYYIANLLRHLQENGCVTGAAFPSSHISGSIIWSLATKRYAPGWGRGLLIFTAGVAVSTVYLGYHHGMDPIFGLILGISCYKVGGLFLGDRK